MAQPRPTGHNGAGRCRFEGTMSKKSKVYVVEMTEDESTTLHFSVYRVRRLPDGSMSDSERRYPVSRISLLSVARMGRLLKSIPVQSSLDRTRRVRRFYTRQDGEDNRAFFGRILDGEG